MDARPGETVVSRDPAQLRWAIDDLGDLARISWDGRAAVIETGYMTRFTRAAELITGAYLAGEVACVAPLQDALAGVQRDSEHEQTELFSKLEHLRIKHDIELDNIRKERNTKVQDLEREVVDLRIGRKVYREAYELVVVALEDIGKELEKIGFIGNGENPIEELLEKIESTQDTATDMIEKYEDGSEDET